MLFCTIEPVHFVQRLRMREQEHQSPEDRGVQIPALDFAKNNDLRQVPVVVFAGHYIYISAGQYFYSHNGFTIGYY